MEAVEIGTARPDELDAMLGLMCESFGLPFAAAREVFYSDPYFEIENKRVLRVNGRLISCLTLVDTVCWLGAGQARLAGIAGVATVPEWRRRGYAGLLLSETVRELARRGYALSALFPYAYGYYRKFGWELAGFAHRYLTAPANLPSYPEAQRVRLAHADDIPALERLYNAAARGKTFHCLRDAKRWRYLFEHVRQRVVYSPDKVQVEGYLLYDFRTVEGESGANAPGVVQPLSLRILEMVAANEAARRGLVGFLASQDGVGCLEYTATWADLEANGLLQTVAPCIETKDALASVEIVPALMARVIDLARVAEALRPNWAGFYGTLAFVMRDPLVETGAQAVIVTGAGLDDPQVSAARAEALPPVADSIVGDVGAWSQVVVGHLSGEEACALGLLQPSTPRAHALVAPLFPRRTPFLPVPDHF
jgi:predicted acetyltransferase